MTDQILSAAAPAKRNLKEILPQEFAGKLRSKLDLYWYLDKQCKLKHPQCVIF